VAGDDDFERNQLIRMKRMFLFLTVMVAAFSQHAFGFYNSSEGRWLNRDTAGEGGGSSLFAFADNDPINKGDLFGLQRCWMTPLVFDNGSDPYFKKDPGAHAYTQSRVNRGNPSDESCDCNRVKLVGLDVTCASTVTFAAGWGPFDRLYAGSQLTLMDHENGHAAISCDIAGIQEGILSRITQCVRRECYDAVKDYFNAAGPYYSAEESRRHAQLDADQYQPNSIAQDEARRNAERYAQERDNAKRAMDTARGKADEACGSN
jgi:hypothetical protein